MSRSWKIVGIAVVLSIFVAETGSATDYTSSSFIIRDPVIVVGSAYGTSMNFQYFSSTGQTAIGARTSATFEHRSGFLYFPTVTVPMVTGTAGDATVDLSWTAATTALGFTVSGYSVGRSTTSGGPYTYTSVGLVLSTTVSGLSNGTTYYFVVRVHDAFDNVIATSAQASATPTGPVVGAVPGAGGSGPLPPPTVPVPVSFDGWGYPGGTVILFRDGERIASTTAADDGSFTVRTGDLEPGTYTLGVGTFDSGGFFSGIVNFIVRVTSGRTTTLQNILLPPTLMLDREAVRPGDSVTAGGQATPGATVDVRITKVGETTSVEPARSQTAEELIFDDVATIDAGGVYTYVIDTTAFPFGTYRVQTRARLSETLVSAGSMRLFEVGPLTIPVSPVSPGSGACRGPADFNCDGQVDLIDFSILIYWFNRFEVPARIDLSGDGHAEIVDVSILVYSWTG